MQIKQNMGGMYIKVLTMLYRAKYVEEWFACPKWGY